MDIGVCELDDRVWRFRNLLTAAASACPSRSSGVLRSIADMPGLKTGYLSCADGDDENFPMVERLDKPITEEEALRTSYWYTGDSPLTYEKILSTRKLVRSKFGRALKKIMGDDIRDENIADIVEAVQAVMRYDPEEFTIKYGYDVEEAYNYEVGGDSCMTGDCSHYTRVYANNPERVGLLVHRPKSGGRSARALIWTNDKGEKLVDRVYGGNAFASRMFKKYAEENGALFHETWDDSHRFKVKVKLPDNGFFPYMDTLEYASLCDDGEHAWLYSYSPTLKSGKYIYTLRCTDGGPFECENVYYCECCDSRIVDGEEYGGLNDILCEDCYNAAYTTCDECGEELLRDDALVPNDCYDELCDSCYHERYFHCYDCGDETPADEQCDHDGYCLCQECYDERIEDEKQEK